MNIRRLSHLLWFLWTCIPCYAESQNIDKEIAALAEKVSSQILASGRTKITVLDFTDLQGNVNQLGQFLAEQLSVSVVEGRKKFAVVDRSNLKTILAEHKLTFEGLVEPENAKTLGKFSGVDAIVLGTVTVLKDEIVLGVKLIATDSAEIVGGTKARIPRTQDIETLLPKVGPTVQERSPVGNTEQSTANKEPRIEPANIGPKDSLGYQARKLFFHLESIRVVSESAMQIRFLEVTLSITNTDSVNVAALKMIGSPLARLTDENGYVFDAQGPGYEREYISPNIATRLTGEENSFSSFRPSEKSKMSIRLYNSDHGRGRFEATQPMRLLFEIWTGEYSGDNLNKKPIGGRVTVWIETNKK